MNKLLTTLALIGTTLTPAALAAPHRDPEITKWKSYHAMGCMLLRECREGVTEIKHVEDIMARYPDSNYGPVYLEMTELFGALEDLGIQVFLGDQKYFPPLFRGSYQTEENKFFLNDSYMHDPVAFAQVMRHEGWHVVQDCMAGSIDNSMMAVIHVDEEVPEFFRDMAERTYTGLSERARPWEQEALWAGWTEMKTVRALRVCSNGSMWEQIEPTPKTKEWLRDNGFLK